MEFRFDAKLCSISGNENSDTVHIIIKMLMRSVGSPPLFYMNNIFTVSMNRHINCTHQHNIQKTSQTAPFLLCAHFWQWQTLCWRPSRQYFCLCKVHPPFTLLVWENKLDTGQFLRAYDIHGNFPKVPCTVNEV